MCGISYYKYGYMVVTISVVGCVREEKNGNNKDTIRRKDLR